MESSPSEQSKGGPVITNSLGTGIALVVAALAAVGLSGGALTRSVRNFPIPISVILCVALIASLAIALLINKTGSAWANVVVYAAAVLLVIAACGAVALGAYSVHEREQPSVSLAAEYGADGKALVTVSVAAAGLSTQDQLVVQILGLRTFTRLDKTSVSLCEQSYTWSKTDGRGVELDTYLEQQGLSADDATLLAWNRIGPDANGVIDVTFKLDLPAQKYGGLCAFSPLPSDPAQALSNSAAYIQLVGST